jgi:hypothetical protein
MPLRAEAHGCNKLQLPPEIGHPLVLQQMPPRDLKRKTSGSEAPRPELRMQIASQNYDS